MFRTQQPRLLKQINRLNVGFDLLGLEKISDSVKSSQEHARLDATFWAI